jgi:AcrR family transcriptional regulator
VSKDNQRTGLRERKKAKTMAAIQMHALRLFREQGYNATTVEQIADAAEISPSTFFRYFSTKEDVVSIDNYDPILIAAFEEQPSHLTPLQAVCNAMFSGLTDLSPEEFSAVMGRNQLGMTVPELRASLLNSMTTTMQLITELVAKRMGRSQDDTGIRALAGAVIGVNISVMLYCAEHPDADFVEMLKEGYNKLESGLTL